MRFWDAITGRARPKAPNLDSLFLVPSAAITLQTAAGYLPTGTGSVCYRSAAGAAFAQTQSEALQLIGAAEPGSLVERARISEDEFGYTWLTITGAATDVAALCTDLHAANTALEAQGFGSSLLCTVVAFADPTGRRFGLVYLYKQGTFYPFAPIAGERRRDNLQEIGVRDLLTGELPMEPDLQRWMAVWNAPGL